MNESLYTRRNIPECMGTAWTLMSTNIARTARTMWLPAVILAVLCAATALLNIYQSGQIAGGNINCALAICVVAGLVLLVAASLFLDAKIFKLLSLQSLRYCWARTS
ncbi:MAG: hypothetical protein LUC22_02445, partial [Prevotella sp.]|nr:hypothetical protein [Prevotella sp.]